MHPKPSKFILYVPVSGLPHSFAPGSAIVASVDQRASKRILVHYEGNVYDDHSMRDYAVRAFHAADRQSKRYPTIAKTYVEPESIVEVGIYDLEARQIAQVTNPEALAQWIPGQADWVASLAKP